MTTKLVTNNCHNVPTMSMMSIFEIPGFHDNDMIINGNVSAVMVRDDVATQLVLLCVYVRVCQCC